MDMKKLEQRVSDLESKLTESKSAESKKPPRPPRKPSEYNTFMGEYMAKHKDPKKKHSDLFSEAVKAWNAKK